MTAEEFKQRFGYDYRQAFSGHYPASFREQEAPGRNNVECWGCGSIVREQDQGCVECWGGNNESAS